MAWKVNDTVVHAREGVCIISSIEELSMSSDGPTEYYILSPVYEKGSRIYVPLALADNVLRKPLTKDEIEALIKEIPKLGIKWISDEKKRQKSLQEDIKSGSHATLLGIIATLYSKKKEIGESGRKFHSSDEHFLNEAEKQINREFGYVLGIKPGDVPAYIGTKIDKKKKK